MDIRRQSLKTNARARHWMRAGAMIAAGVSLMCSAPAWAWDDLTPDTGKAFDAASVVAKLQDADFDASGKAEPSYEPTRIVLRDAAFGFNFIAFLPKPGQKIPNQPRIVALFDQKWAAVGEERLDESRGGFDAGGLIMTFGIERAVYINGQLVTTTSFNVSDMGKITTDQLKTLSAQAASMGLVQNGPNNTFQLTSGGGGLPGSVIQNTLNNQNIKSTTIINATSNSLNLIKGINTLGTLNDVVNGSLRH